MTDLQRLLIGLIKQWILPGTAIINDCWAACSSLLDEGYSNYHSVTIVNETTWAHTNTMKSIWKQVKTLLSPYGHKADYVYFLAEYMFRQKCKAEDVDPFCKFIQVVATTDWSNTPLIHSDITCVCVRCYMND